MTEIKNKVLSGVVTETSSSDAFITRTVNQMKAGIIGTNGQILNITPSEPYSPVSGLTRPSVEEISIDPSTARRINHTETLSHVHSKMALGIRNRREALRSIEEKTD